MYGKNTLNVQIKTKIKVIKLEFTFWMKKNFPYRELNPGLPGESRVS